MGDSKRDRKGKKVIDTKDWYDFQGKLIKEGKSYFPQAGVNLNVGNSSKFKELNAMFDIRPKSKGLFADEDSEVEENYEIVVEPSEKNPEKVIKRRPIAKYKTSLQDVVSQLLLNSRDIFPRSTSVDFDYVVDLINSVLGKNYGYEDMFEDYMEYSAAKRENREPELGNLEYLVEKDLSRNRRISPTDVIDRCLSEDSDYGRMFKRNGKYNVPGIARAVNIFLYSGEDKFTEEEVAKYLKSNK